MATQNNENEIFENPDALAEQFNKTEDFLKKNKTIVLGAIAAVILASVGFVFWKKSSEEKELQAAEDLYKAEYYFGLDSLKLALEGNDEFDGFTTIASDFAGTKAGNLAKLYSGCIYLKQGDFEESSSVLSDFDTDAFLVSARAYALAGDAFLEADQADNAIKFYTKATKHEPNKEFTPGYLIKLATAQESTNDFAGALLTYESFVKEYPRDRKIDDVKKYLAKVQLLASKKS